MTIFSFKFARADLLGMSFSFHANMSQDTVRLLRRVGTLSGEATLQFHFASPGSKFFAIRIDANLEGLCCPKSQNCDNMVYKSTHFNSWSADDVYRKHL